MTLAPPPIGFRTAPGYDGASGRRDGRPCHAAAADHKRATLAARVVLGEMDRIADALAAMDAKAVALREALYSAAACYLIVPGASPPVIAISPKARDTLLREPLQLSVDHEFNRELRDWHAALMRNSEAIFGEGDTDAGDRTSLPLPLPPPHKAATRHPLARKAGCSPAC